jgi:hypothetical protein
MGSLWYLHPTRAFRFYDLHPLGPQVRVLPRLSSPSQPEAVNRVLLAFFSASGK